MITMHHAKLGPIRKFERVVCVGTHVLVCSVEGKPETFARMTSAIDRWFGGVKFAAIG